VKAEVAFRLGSDADDAQLVALFASVFRAPPSLEDWRWLSRQNPDGENRVYVLRGSAHQVVGCYCTFPTTILSGRRRIRAAFPNHLAIREGFRDPQTFMELVQFASEQERARGTELDRKRPNRNSYLPHKMLAGFSDFRTVELLYREKSTVRSHGCRKIERFDASFEIFLRSATESFALGFEKSVAWLNWRYFERPANPYTAYAYSPSGKLAGFIVLKFWKEPSGFRKAHIMDLWSASDAATSELLAAADSFAAECDELNLWCVEHFPWRAALDAHGFVARPSATQPVITRSLGSEIEFRAGASSFMYGDGDGY